MTHPEPGEVMEARVRASLERQAMMATLGVELIAILLRKIIRTVEEED